MKTVISPPCSSKPARFSAAIYSWIVQGRNLYYWGSTMALNSSRRSMSCSTIVHWQCKYAYASQDSAIASQTISTAQAGGWIWDIGLPTRRGTGYVYSSAHISDEKAQAALRAYLIKSGAPKEISEPRKLSFNPGYRKQFWVRNCVAIGQSAGFIEPLEASALAMVELSVVMLSDDMPATRDAMEMIAQRFNDAFTYRWERVIDFLKLHYVLSQRTDSDYWHDNRQAESIPQRFERATHLMATSQSIAL